jgi:hypothetical protein
MASHGTRVFVLGGESSAGPQADEAMLIHVLDTSTYFLLSFHLDSLQSRNTEYVKYPNSEANVVDPTCEGPCVGLWNLCGLWKPKLRRRGGTRNV